MTLQSSTSPVAVRNAILAAAVLPAARLQAHPGHGYTSPNPGHWVTSPDHLATLTPLLVGMGVVFWAAGRFIARGRHRCWMESLGLIVGCSAGVLWGLGR